MENIKYVVELETGVWLAPWDGDPGRTLKIENAEYFLRKRYAQKALLKAKKDYPQRKFKHGCVRRVNVATSEATAILRSVSNSACLCERVRLTPEEKGLAPRCMQCGEYPS